MKGRRKRVRVLSPGDLCMTTIDQRREALRPFDFLSVFRGTLSVLVVSSLCSRPALADDTEVGKRLKEKGVAVTQSKGIVTAVAVEDGAKLSNEDFQQIARLSHLKTLSLNNCLTDERLALLTTLSELEYLQTNLAQITDDGL